jgi:hypothetical protein
LLSVAATFITGQDSQNHTITGKRRPGDCEGLGARNGLRRRRRGSQEQIVRWQHRAELRIEALPRLAMIGRPAQRFSFLYPSRFFLAIHALGAYI